MRKGRVWKKENRKNNFLRCSDMSKLTRWTHKDLVSRESVPFNGQKMRSDCSNYVSKLWISGNIMLPRKFFLWTRKLPCIFATLFVFSLNAWGWVIPYEGCSTSFLCFSQHTLSPYTETLTVETKNWIRFHHNGPNFNFGHKMALYCPYSHTEHTDFIALISMSALLWFGVCYKLPEST